MNEEELKKGCGKELMFGGICEEDNLCIKCENLIEGFQKGKLEQKKEELKFLISEYFVYLNIDGGFIRDKIVKRIKQLQKEIGEEKGK
jgi:hypothetical protein